MPRPRWQDRSRAPLEVVHHVAVERVHGSADRIDVRSKRVETPGRRPDGAPSAALNPARLFDELRQVPRLDVFTALTASRRARDGRLQDFASFATCEA